MSTEQPTPETNQPLRSTAKWTYRNYTEHLSEKQARMALFMIAGLVLVGEIGLRVKHISYERTPQNSFYGIRTQLIETEATNTPKIIAIGDSSLEGGGVMKAKDTAVGMLKRNRKDFSVYNLGVPGGTNFTNLQLLRHLENRKIKNLDVIVLETLPTKFLVEKDGASAEKGTNAVNEMQRFAVFADLDKSDVPHTPLTPEVANDTMLQYLFAKESSLYYNRDFFRLNITGGYPAFWAVATVTPPSLRNKLFPNKEDGQQRLSAEANDQPFQAKNVKPNDTPVFFSTKGQFERLVESVRLAKTISKHPPVILINPWHYEYTMVTPEAIASAKNILSQMRASLEKVAKDEGAILVFTPSETLQDPALWLRTRAHFNKDLHKIVFEQLNKGIDESLATH